MTRRLPREVVGTAFDGLRTLVRDKLERGSVPREKCLITWFGPGSGQRCVGVLRFHQPCFAVWDETRQAIGV